MLFATIYTTVMTSRSRRVVEIVVQLLPQRARGVAHGDLHDGACGAELRVVKIVVKIVVERGDGLDHDPARRYRARPVGRRV